MNLSPRKSLLEMGKAVVGAATGPGTGVKNRSLPADGREEKQVRWKMVGNQGLVSPSLLRRYGHLRASTPLLQGRTRSHWSGTGESNSAIQFGRLMPCQ